MAYVYYNPNPLNKSVADCTLRALTKALDMSWEQAYMDLSVQGYLLSDMPKSAATFHSYLKQKGFSRHIIPDTCPDCYTIGDFVAEHPHGTYIVATADHVVAITDGTLYDSWDSSNEIPQYYWRKEY